MQEHYTKTIIPMIESVYGSLTAVERSIADFFIQNRTERDFSAKHIAQLLFVSEASLSRFAQKCGYKGYREFVFHYVNGLEEQDRRIGQITKSVLNTYQELLSKSFSLLNESQMHNIAEMLTKAEKVFVYGMGSSGLAAQEIRLRFMRLGLSIEAITDSHIMKINTALVLPQHLVIGISISGQTKEVISSLKQAHKRGAKTLLITANNDFTFTSFCDEMLLVAVTKNLVGGNVISPQFPVLIMVDIFFSYFLNADYYQKLAYYTDTLSALSEENSDKS